MKKAKKLLCPCFPYCMGLRKKRSANYYVADDDTQEAYSERCSDTESNTSSKSQASLETIISFRGMERLNTCPKIKASASPLLSSHEIDTFSCHDKLYPHFESGAAQKRSSFKSLACGGDNNRVKLGNCRMHRKIGSSLCATEAELEIVATRLVQSSIMDALFSFIASLRTGPGVEATVVTTWPRNWNSPGICLQPDSGISYLSKSLPCLDVKNVAPYVAKLFVSDGCLDDAQEPSLKSTDFLNTTSDAAPSYVWKSLSEMSNLSQSLSSLDKLNMMEPDAEKAFENNVSLDDALEPPSQSEGTSSNHYRKLQDGTSSMSKSVQYLNKLNMASYMARQFSSEGHLIDPQEPSLQSSSSQSAASVDTIGVTSCSSLEWDTYDIFTPWMPDNRSLTPVDCG